MISNECRSFWPKASCWLVRPSRVDERWTKASAQRRKYAPIGSLFFTSLLISFFPNSASAMINTTFGGSSSDYRSSSFPPCSSPSSEGKNQTTVSLLRRRSPLLCCNLFFVSCPKTHTLYSLAPSPWKKKTNVTQTSSHTKTPYGL